MNHDPEAAGFTTLDLQAALQAIEANSQLDQSRHKQLIYIGRLLSEPSVPQTRQERASA